MVKIELDQNKCIGCGTCVALCPDYFEMEGAKAKPKTSDDIGEGGCAKEAANNCPVSAIQLK